ncbi:hypothetical protein CDAR_370761 [Caerostris darwini]|uniref:Uncharacterized protein n=1 Tax=Caerostris darwini TaxID=1538125 RepID=A0AAV4VGU1_9ARAC|nr:hypothetical protein CDAR_370761 [Caerostris darwini]
MGRPPNQLQFFHKSAPRREGLIPIDLLRALFAVCCFWKVLGGYHCRLPLSFLIRRYSFRIIGIKDNRRGMRACLLVHEQEIIFLLSLYLGKVSKHYVWVVDCENEFIAKLCSPSQF